MALQELLTVELVERELITCELKVIDILSFREKRIVSGLIHEVPTKITAIRFETSEDYTSGSLSVYLNGLKIRIIDITEINSKIFEIVDVTKENDTIEVSYLEKT